VEAAVEVVPPVNLAQDDLHIRFVIYERTGNKVRQSYILNRE
jgi:hypothetical protein